MRLLSRLRKLARFIPGACLAVLCLCGTASAGPINTDVALTPRKGGAIFRLQYRYTDADGAGMIQHVNSSNVIGTFVYGITERLAMFLTLPYANRQVDRVVPRMGRVEQAHDGLADITFKLKYRFWQKDLGVGDTLRWAALGGLNIRSGDGDFSSDSYDPIIGTVFSARMGRMIFDTDLVYQMNTGRGEFRHDTLRYDVSAAYRLVVGETRNTTYELDTVIELNGRYVADGTHELYLSPGLQFITEQWALEASIQLPVVQDLSSGQPEPSVRLVAGLRLSW